MDGSLKDGNVDQDYFRVISQPGKLALLEALTQARHSRAERLAAGQALRQQAPRGSHSEYRPSADRLSPIERIEIQNASLLPKLVGLRMARMSATPFAFLRGTAAVMAADLAATPATGLQVMACGDMHLANFGLFASAERNLVFGINDFDEVHPGAWEWDLKRLAASAAVAVTFAGGDRVHAEGAARAAVQSYIRQIRRYSEMGFLETWYDLIDGQDILHALPPGRTMKNAVAALAKARGRDRHKSFEQLAETVAGQRRIIEQLPLVVRETHLPDGRPVIEALEGILRSYLRSLPQDRTRLLSRYRVVDVARKVVGVGSVGTSCWIVLMEGLDVGDPLLLQVKEAGDSVLAPYATAALPIKNQGQRVVFGQRMIQGSPDIFLGWGPEDGGKGRDFYVRQLADMKGGRKFIEGDRETLDGLEAYCGLCGRALALAHAKSGDPATIAGYCGSSDALPDAIGEFAIAYAEQTERDHGDLVAAIRQGRLPASEEAS